MMRRSSGVWCLAVAFSVVMAANTVQAGLYDWHYTTVDSTRKVGHHLSVAVDVKRDIFFVAYYDDVDFDLRLARRLPGGTWQYYLVDSTGDVGQYNSIDVRSGACVSELAISYYDATNGALKVAFGHCDETGCDPFTPQTIDSGVPAAGTRKGLHTSLKIDNIGTVHVAYQYLRDAATDSLLYAKKLGSGIGNCGPGNFWQCSTLITGEGYGQYASMDLDLSNHPSIASYYYGSGTGYPFLMSYVGTGGGTCGPSSAWVCTSAHIPGQDLGRYISLYVEDNGSPHLAFYNATTDTLTYAYPDPGGSGYTCGTFDDTREWQCDAIEVINYSVTDMGIAITGDGPGEPIIAYEYVPLPIGPSQLRVARPKSLYPTETANCGPLLNWVCQVVDSGGQYEDEAAAVAMTTGKDGNPVIAYHELNTYPVPYEGRAKLVYHPRMDIFLDGFECGNTAAWSAASP